MTETIIRPYGDTLNDGMVQLSFTLPVENGPKAKKAAEVYVAKLNFKDAAVVHAKKIADNFTFFVVYARAIPTLDYSKVKPDEIEIKAMSFSEINRLIKSELRRPLTVVGATIGNDAHTVGIDAIMNMKGYNQDYGLERYPQINACNMGAQVPCEALVKKALELNADAILVSQTVTQKDSHIRNLTELTDFLKAKNLRSRFILVAGGPGITNDFAKKLGYDTGFGPGTVPSFVASFLIVRLLEKME